MAILTKNIGAYTVSIDSSSKIRYIFTDPLICCNYSEGNCKGNGPLRFVFGCSDVLGILLFTRLIQWQWKGDMTMTYKEKKRSLFLGLPWTFTSYTVTDEIITIDSGLLKKEENDCYLYKVIDVRLETRLFERMLGLGTIHCFTGDVTDPDLKLLHIRHAKEIKDYILKQSEQERLKRKTLNTQHLDGNPGISKIAQTDSCR